MTVSYTATIVAGNVSALRRMIRRHHRLHLVRHRHILLASAVGDNSAHKAIYHAAERRILANAYELVGRLEGAL
jgi:hypothetical protein